VIVPRYRTRGSDFLRIDFHHTNYGVDDLNGVVVGYADKGGLVIVATRHWSQGSLQSPIQNVKKMGLLEEFLGPSELFVWMVAVRLCMLTATPKVPGSNPG
jgi:hypothetical protein